MTSVLENDYVEQSRPYSQNELNNIKQQTYRNFRLGKSRAYHMSCNHCYLVKKNGRKEREMNAKSSYDVGNCSVCWKIGKTPVRLLGKASKLAKVYNDTPDNKILKYQDVILERIFYKWLYEDFYSKTN
jgi:hypothetical protein